MTSNDNKVLLRGDQLTKAELKQRLRQMNVLFNEAIDEKRYYAGKYDEAMKNPAKVDLLAVSIQYDTEQSTKKQQLKEEMNKRDKDALFKEPSELFNNMNATVSDKRASRLSILHFPIKNSSAKKEEAKSRQFDRKSITKTILKLKKDAQDKCLTQKQTGSEMCFLTKSDIHPQEPQSSIKTDKSYLQSQLSVNDSTEKEVNGGYTGLALFFGFGAMTMGMYYSLKFYLNSTQSNTSFRQFLSTTAERLALIAQSGYNPIKDVYSYLLSHIITRGKAALSLNHSLIVSVLALGAFTLWAQYKRRSMVLSLFNDIKADIKQVYDSEGDGLSEDAIALKYASKLNYSPESFRNSIMPALRLHKSRDGNIQETDLISNRKKSRYWQWAPK